MVGEAEDRQTVPCTAVAGAGCLLPGGAVRLAGPAVRCLLLALRAQGSPSAARCEAHLERPGSCASSTSRGVTEAALGATKQET